MAGTATKASLAAAAAVAVIACADPTVTAGRPLAIVGGEPSPGPAGVGYLAASSGDSGECTATLISPRVALTAAHCVEPAAEAGDALELSFGPSTAALVETIAVDRQLIHPAYVAPQSPDDDIAFDLALVRLAAAAQTASPVPWRDGALGDVLGSDVTVVGYGVTDVDSLSGEGERRQVTLPVEEVTDEHLGLGNSRQNICFGDSGGPALQDGAVVAVISFTQNFCTARSFVTRTDRHAAFIAEVLAAWDGPCPDDGTCDPGAECGAFADPDCDVCGVNGTCGAECSSDLDCPGGGRDPGGCGCAAGRGGGGGRGLTGIVFIFVVLGGIAWIFRPGRIRM